MERLILTDAQWAKMEPCCLGKPGNPRHSGKTIACLSRRCCGLFAPAVRGVICRVCSELEQRLHALRQLREAYREGVRIAFGQARHPHLCGCCFTIVCEGEMLDQKGA